MTSSEIRVYVIEYPDRRFLQLRYRDPATGKQHTRSAKTANRSTAERRAVEWEVELRASGVKPRGAMLWTEFRQRYEDEVLAALSPGTRNRASTVFALVENTISPMRLRDIGHGDVSRLAKHMRDAGNAETTISGNLGYLKAALGWAKDMKFLAELPLFPKQKRAKVGSKAKLMKGRPLTDDEFQSLLKAAHRVIPKEFVKQWQRSLKGLWLSGLRLDESIRLQWDSDAELGIDLTHKYPMIRIRAESEKGHTERLLPMVPQFAAWLDEVPKPKRTGSVFLYPKRPDWTGGVPFSKGVSKWICQIGKAAGIVVDDRSGKFASAHDLRRSFGERWSRKVMPQVLMELMRHENIETTLRYYIGRNAESTAELLWNGNTLGST